MSRHTSLPHQYDPEMFNGLIKALKELGGSATKSKATDKVADILGLSREQLAIKQTAGKRHSAFSWRLAWTRYALDKYGLIRNPTQGVWQLTDKGRTHPKITAEISGKIRRTTEDHKKRHQVAKRKPNKTTATETPKMGTFTSAALIILSEHRKPMHGKDITVAALKRNLIVTVGKTPTNTMITSINNDIRAKGPDSKFTKVGPSIFNIRSKKSAGAERPARTTSIQTPEQLPRAQKDNADKLLDYLKSFDKSGYQLELVVVALLSSSRMTDYENPQATPRGKDRGVDIFVDYSGDDFSPKKCRVAIQVKNYSSKKVDAKEIRQLRGSDLVEHSDKLWFVTTSEFTADAVRDAEGNRSKPVKLTNGRDLALMLIESDVSIGLIYPMQD